MEIFFIPSNNAFSPKIKRASMLCSVFIIFPFRRKQINHVSAFQVNYFYKVCNCYQTLFYL